ncbi:hypothetical protein FF098_000600 [Parvularcula flava]|uniref:Uncharacterized protein n=1 Tax=Aquisalinus luteolus TaxID=1566827 RepID=A0A8J3A025_9PROT|nr:hypothetical protein [Aquisalinus luteolus]NHK26400.1 hypothetical protein [Aquisalinus luteolus]GGH92223.1 hypothetical protein GCM10011355_01210 [Aquisalinus luteolus]
MTDILRIVIAPLVWLAAFTTVYALHGLVCGHAIGGMPFGTISVPRLLLVSAYALAICAQIILLISLYARRFATQSEFVRFVSRATGWTALVATVWTLLPTVTMSHCL